MMRIPRKTLALLSRIVWHAVFSNLPALLPLKHYNAFPCSCITSAACLVRMIHFPIELSLTWASAIMVCHSSASCGDAGART